MPDPVHGGPLTGEEQRASLTASEAALQRVREDRLLIDRVDLWLYAEIAPYVGQRVLEIGCGLGNFARYLTRCELYLGTDLSAESVAHVNRLYHDQPHMQARVADVTSPSFLSLAGLQVDTIFSLNVLEHVEDHAEALRNAKAVLEPGGALILVVPAHAWLYGTMDRALGHCRRYSKEAMAALLGEVGLALVKLKYLNALGALGWYVNGRIRRQQTPPANQLRLFNKLVPLVQRMERAAPPPFGISLLAVARKAVGQDAILPHGGR